MTTLVKKQDSFRSGNSFLAAAAVFFFVTTASAVSPWTILINTNFVLNVTNYGAVNDGVTTNTTAIQNAINAATAGGSTNGLSGGTVEIPAGIFMCGPLTMKKNVNLQIDSGAILRMLVYSNYPGGFVNPANFIDGSSLTNIEISGPGAIDGQGSPWWQITSTNSSYNRPRMINFSGCNRVLIQNITLSNSPMFHLSLSSANVTVQGVTIRAPSSSDPTNPSHNTDACDVNGTNILVQNCDISVGDDNFTCSGGTWDVLLTNNVYGTGHGVSIGSYTDGGVSNFLVINCSFTGTDNGIRLKSERGRGGIIQNLTYCNLMMTNVAWPLLIYSYYEYGLGTLTGVNPMFAANVDATNFTAYTSTDPLWQNITFSNITAVLMPSGRPPLMVWGLPEALASNIVFRSVNITSSSTLAPEVLNATNVQFLDCNFHLPNGVNDVQFFNAGLIFSNTPVSANAINLWILDGLTTNGYGNTMQFYNALGTLKNTNAFDNGPLTISSSTFTFSNNLTLAPTTVLNFTLGTNAATVVVKGNLALGGTNNFTAGEGFAAGTYVLMTNSGTISGTLPVIGSKPVGYSFVLSTNATQLLLTVASTAIPVAPTNLIATAGNASVSLTWSSVASASGYNVKRSTVSGSGYSTIAGNVATTSYSDTQVTNGTTYFYVVSSTNSVGESTNSAEVSATPQAQASFLVTTNVFNDVFLASTLNSAAPSAPTGTNTSYELVSSKTWSPTPGIAAGHLKFGVAATTSGSIETQALFTNSPVTLANIGESISLFVTFTNTSGLLTQSGVLGFGLYCSGGNYPVPGGLNGTATSSSTGNSVGNAQTWAGYVGQLAFTGGTSRIMTRPAQVSGGLLNSDQDTVTSGSSSSSFTNNPPVTVGTASTTPSVTLVAGNPYTEALTVTLTAANTLAITNSFFSGTDTNGTLLSTMGGVASGSTYLTNAFDALAVGWRTTANTAATTIDINNLSISITRLVVTVTNAPPIPTTNTIQSSVNPSTYGNPVIFTATVNPAPTNGEPVAFKDGSTVLGTGILSGGQATYTTSATQFATGSHSVTAVYAGDGTYGASISSPLTQTVNPLALTVSGLAVSNKVYDGTTAAALNTNGYTLNTVIGGDAVMLVTNGYTATFASANAANGISVTVAGLSLGGAQAGDYTLAQLVGLTANITPAGSSVLLGSSANPAAHLSGVSFTASVTPSTLSGSILFLTNGVAFDSEMLSGGIATSVSTTRLPRGANLITAQYSGTANYLPSTNTLNQVVTNNPPVANPATDYRLVGYPLTIVITNLATNWSDLDGDSLVLAGVNTSSTNGGAVTYDNTNIYYTDSNNVTDQFGYTISDGQGGITGGMVTVLLARQNVSWKTINADGSVTLGFSGIPGSIYWVEAATNLTPPAGWMLLSTNVADTNGLWQFTDAQATNFLQRFYRTQLGQ